jgi:large subunit ribosomal protein L16
VARVKPGRVIFEIDGVTADRQGSAVSPPLLPIKTRFVARIAE